MMNQAQISIQQSSDAAASVPATSLALQQTLGPKATKSLQQMFRDPRVLESDERGELVASLSKAVEMFPAVPEVRVMLGMALCVDLRAQEAMTRLREAVEQDPACYIAQLKLGELMMRLRICDKAADHTYQAARLAANDMQAELARRQAATIRQMQREGIERGGYGGVLAWAKSFGKRRSSQQRQPALAVSE
jgi:Flp pilus assembly protein TadD